VTAAGDEAGEELTAAQIKERLGGLTSGNILTLRSGPVEDQKALLSQVNVDPLVTTGWQALLGIAFVAVLIVSAAGYLIHARTSFIARRSEFALFRTVGISKTQLLVLIAVEQLAVIGVAFAIGVFLGTRLGDTIFPFLAASGESGSLAPPMVVQIQGAGVAIVFGTLAVVFAGAIAVALWSAARLAIYSVMRAGDG
jgi:ABC-type antimicrobial peptide transport system permease subunit